MNYYDVDYQQLGVALILIGLSLTIMLVGLGLSVVYGWVLDWLDARDRRRAERAPAPEPAKH